MTIRNRLWLMASVVALLIGTMAAVSYVVGDRVMEGQINSVGIEMAESAAHSTELYIERLEMVLLNIAEGVRQLRETGKGLSAPDLQPHMARYTEENRCFGVQTVYMAFEDVTGAESFSDGTGWIPAEDYDPKVRGWYRQAADSGELSITDPYQDGITGNMVISLVMPFKEGGELVGVIGLDVETSALSRFIVGQKIMGEGSGILLDRSGNVIAAPNEDWVMKENFTKPSKVISAEMVKAGQSMLSEERSFRDYVSTVDGRRKRIFFAPSSKGVFVGIEYPVAEIRSLVNRLTKVQVMLGGLVLIIAVGMVLFIARRIRQSLKRLLDITDAARTGDLTVEYSGNGKDELDRIGTAFNEVLSGLRDLISTADGSAQDTLDKSESLAAISQETVASMEEVRASMEVMSEKFEANAATLEEANAGVDEITRASRSVAETASEGAAGADRTRKATQEVVEGIGKVLGDMVKVERSSQETADKAGLLEEAVRQITGFVTSITSIADQTNLLALNAAIEAARAGEAGRGFAVVAEEVRKLAEESGQAAKEIDTLIATLRGHSESSVTASGQTLSILRDTIVQARSAQEKLHESVAETEKMLGLMQSLAAVAQEQAASGDEMTQAVDSVAKSTVELSGIVESVRKSTEETTNASESVAGEAQTLSEMAGNLQELLGKFKVISET